MKLLAFFVICTTLLSPITTSAAFAEVVFDPSDLLSDEEFLDVSAMTREELNQFLQRGFLGSFVTEDVHGVPVYASQIIWDAAQEFGLNPKFLLVLLQREQSLIEDDLPTQDQLDWAMGYAVCDDCAKNDPRIQKFKGFGNQVYYAAKRIRESYLTDLEDRGFTESGVGPGIEAKIDGTIVVPVNKVTSALYTYTPHLHGNKNFVMIWNRWFTRDYLTGTLLQDRTTGGIWLIQQGVRRPIQSRAAFHSRFNENQVVQASASQLELYEIGKPIAFPNYSLLRSPHGTVYLIVDDTRRGFTSQEAFRALGFTSDEVVDVEFEDLEAFVEGDPITTEVVYPQGALLQNNVTGGIFFVQNGQKHPIMSKQLLEANQLPAAIVPVTPADLDAYATADPLAFPDGTLIAATGSPDVFVVADGQRHPIANAETFLSYGWQWDQIVWTNERSVLIHPLGDTLASPTHALEDLLIATDV